MPESNDHSSSDTQVVIEKLTFLDEVGIQKLSEAILKKTNSRIADRIVQELNDASDANHVVSAALLNTLLKASDALIDANTTAITTNKTDIDNVSADVESLKTKVADNTTNVTAAADGITALDEKIDGLTHLTTDMVIGPITGVADPKSDVLYLQKDDEADTTWMLYIYREDGTWAAIGDTGTDLSNYWSKDDNDSIKEAISVPEVTPLPEDKILAAINAAFDNTPAFDDPNLQYLSITASGIVSKSDKLKALTADTPIDLVIPSEIDGIKVTSIKVPPSTTITNPDGAFINCNALRSVVIPEGVTIIDSGAFRGCKSLTSITIPEGVTSIGNNAFYECIALTSITIPNSVTNIGGYAFYKCVSLTSVNIPVSVTTIGANVFYDCTSLNTVTIPEGVTSIGSTMFDGCSSLTSVKIPASVTTIGTNAFNYCSGLTDIIINKPQDSISGSPWGAPSATVYWYDLAYFTVTADGAVSATDTLKAMTADALMDLVIPSQIDGIEVTSIAEGGFSGCKSLRLVKIPNSVTKIDVNAFSDCSSLASIIIHEGITTIGASTFDGCTSLTSIYIPEGVTTISADVFNGCTSITDIIINKPQDSITGSPWGATNATVHWNDYSCVTIDSNGAVTAHSALKALSTDNPVDLVIPSQIDGIEVTSIAEGGFSGCKSLTSVTIPEGVISISKNAFNGCRSLRSITIPEGVTSIGIAAFNSCKSLTSVTIPEGVTSIGDGAFAYCTALTTIDIPSSVEHIDGSAYWGMAFKGCTALTTINIHKPANSISGSPWGAYSPTINWLG